MRILIKGAGLTGCTIARLLKDDGHDVFIIEKESEIGGLCATETIDGLYHDKYGPHYFRSDDDDVIKFARRFLKLNNNSHYVGSYINGKLMDWPISHDCINYLKGIFGDGITRSGDYPNVANFEEGAINCFGPILYELFVKHYTENMWHRDPKELSTKMSPRIFHINDNDKRYFRNSYQGYPDGGYTKALEKMIKGIKIFFNKGIVMPSIYEDLTIDCSPIDEVYSCMYGSLDYVGMIFKNEILTTKKEIEKIPSEWYRYSCINFPNCEFDYIRSTVHKNMTRQVHPHEAISYEQPSLSAIKTHPVINRKNELLIDKYLLVAATQPTVLPVGRMGLFKYLSMDTAIKIAMKVRDTATSWSSLHNYKRYEKLVDFRNTQ